MHFVGAILSILSILFILCFLHWSPTLKAKSWLCAPCQTSAMRTFWFFANCRFSLLSARLRRLRKHGVSARPLHRLCISDCRRTQKRTPQKRTFFFVENDRRNRIYNAFLNCHTPSVDFVLIFSAEEIIALFGPVVANPDGKFFSGIWNATTISQLNISFDLRLQKKKKKKNKKKNAKINSRLRRFLFFNYPNVVLIQQQPLG